MCDEVRVCQVRVPHFLRDDAAHQRYRTTLDAIAAFNGITYKYIYIYIYKYVYICIYIYIYTNGTAPL